MARARNIKPAFFQNDRLGEIDPLSRLAFIGMWTIANFKGCIEYRPKMLKVQLLPYDNCDIEKIALNLEEAGFIRFYSVQGFRYIKIVNFEKHQNPHKNERESGTDIPDISENNIEIKQLDKDGTKPDLIRTARADSLLLIPSTLTPDNHIPKKTTAEYSAEFLEAWGEYPARQGANKKESFAAWSARLKAGVSTGSMIDGVRRYAAYCKALQTEQQYIKQPQVFFGPKEHYFSDWTIPIQSAKNGTRSPKQDNFAEKDYGTGVTPL